MGNPSDLAAPERFALPPLEDLPQHMRELVYHAMLLAKSGMFADAGDVSKAFAKMLLGQELGISPVASLTNIHMVKGRLMVGAVALGAALRRKGFEYRVKELTDAQAVIEFYSRTDGPGSTNRELLGVSTFSQQDAVRGGVGRDQQGDAGTLKKWPRNMLFSRAMSNGVKWFTPEVIGGAVYVEGELDDVDVDPDPEAIPVQMPRRKSENGAAPMTGSREPAAPVVAQIEAPAEALDMAALKTAADALEAGKSKLAAIAAEMPQDAPAPEQDAEQQPEPERAAAASLAKPAPDSEPIAPATPAGTPAEQERLTAAGWTWDAGKRRWVDPETMGAWPLITALNIQDGRDAVGI